MNMKWKTNLNFEKLQEYILNEDKDTLITVMVLSGNCESQITSFEAVFRNKFVKSINQTDVKSKIVKVFIKEENMPFPMIKAPAIYYFKSGNCNYMFVRDRADAVEKLNEDIKIIIKMLSGMSYYDALYDNSVDRQLIEKTELILEENHSESKYPKTSKMLKDFAKEVWESAKYAGKGLPVLVSSEVASERYSICEQCPNLTEEARCTECGCFMKTKVNLAASSCPIEKWDSVQ